MPYRQFIDDDCVAWHVLDVFAQGRDYRPVAPTDWPSQTNESPASNPRTPDMRQLMATGWLVFQSARERRRLVPIPANWQVVSDDELVELCARAERVVLPPYSIE